MRRSNLGDDDLRDEDEERNEEGIDGRRADQDELQIIDSKGYVPPEHLRQVSAVTGYLEE